MSLGKLTQDKIISEVLTKEFGNEFLFTSPILFKETEDYIFCLNIDISNLGRTTIGNPKIIYKKLNNIINPILDKYDIVYSKWSSGLRNPEKWKEDISYLHTDSEEELSQALKKIIPYIKDFCIPFWNKYQDFQKVLNLISNYSEKELNQGIFQGVVGIMERLTISNIENSHYFNEKKEFYKVLIKEYSEKKPEQYLKLYEAFNNLINILENKVDYL